MGELNSTIQRTRDELRTAFKAAQGDKAEQDRIQQQLEELADMQEQLALDELSHHGAVLNGLSDLLDKAIADIRANIADFFLGDLEDIRKRVRDALGKPPAADAAPAEAAADVPPPKPKPAAAAADAQPKPKPKPADAGPPPVVPKPAAAAAGAAKLDGIDLAALGARHGRFPGSCTWALTAGGIRIEDAAPETTGGQPKTVAAVWENFGPEITASAQKFGVPVELIIATICTESSGKPKAIRFEPGYVSDTATPGKVSPGLMQTLISTARSALGRSDIDRAWLFDSANSIEAGTAYIRSQFPRTGFDPPVVACAYNAGSVVQQGSAANRWRMRQFPIGTSAHCDRFVEWFNDSFRFFAGSGNAPAPSFFRALNG